MITKGVVLKKVHGDPIVADPVIPQEIPVLKTSCRYGARVFLWINVSDPLQSDDQGCHEDCGEDKEGFSIEKRTGDIHAESEDTLPLRQGPPQKDFTFDC
jgi:hypothetical protein